MRHIAWVLNKLLRRFIALIQWPLDQLISYLVLYLNGVEFSTFSNTGWPKISVSKGGKLVIGKGFRSNNREMANPIGRFHPCSIIVGKGARLSIGENVGMSSTAIVCHLEIEVGNDVNFGGGVVVYDTDFHSLKFTHRNDPKLDAKSTIRSPVRIGNGVFVGGHSTILKGVTIADYAVIGACSVVTKDVGTREIWAGNPAKKIGVVGDI